ncbi:response regulator transcription factor [Rhodoferax koreensis]|uniref:response regulator transcription factor n=1 Tax=Rhodoferax koreensis TaxID=1842727 RepID=UPI001EF52C2E|nr:response regulator transcription factor [Rhodoferax koreense]
MLVVDDHPLLMQGIEDILALAPDIQLVGHAGSGLDAISQFTLVRPDVTLMDIQMPGMNGIEAMATILVMAPDARVLILTLHRHESQMREAFAAGAAGYLQKSHAATHLLDAVRTVHAGSIYRVVPVAQQAARSLSVAEIEVLKLAALGYSNRRIGESLDIPEETVKSRMKSILAKLSANDRTHAVTLALQRGIIAML